MDFYAVTTFLLLTAQIWAAPNDGSITVTNEQWKDLMRKNDNSYHEKKRLLMKKTNEWGKVYTPLTSSPPTRTTTKLIWWRRKLNPAEPEFLRFGR